MESNEGAKAFLLGRVHPAIWVSCLGYLAPMTAMFMSDGQASRVNSFGISFGCASGLLLGGALLALWRMRVHRLRHPNGPHHAGRLVAFVNIAMGIGAFVLFLAVQGAPA